MIGQPERETPRENSEECASLRWSVRLSDKAPWKRWVILACALLAGLLGQWLTHNPLLGILGFVAIMGSTAEFWYGTTYKIDDKGVSARTGFSLSGMTWDEVKRAVIDEEGVKLSPLEKSGKLSPFRGVFVRFGENNKQEVLDMIERFGGSSVRVLD